MTAVEKIESVLGTGLLLRQLVRETKRCQEPLFGRPRGRTVDSSPSSATVRFVQRGPPNGTPRTMECRRAESSPSV